MLLIFLYVYSYNEGMEWKMCKWGRKCEQVRELCEVRDRCVTSILNKEESYTIIEFSPAKIEKPPPHPSTLVMFIFNFILICFFIFN